jgi:hypothetical protein
MRQLSAHDGLSLPVNWCHRHPEDKGCIIRYFQERRMSRLVDPRSLPGWWLAMPGSDKQRVLRHLETVGSLPPKRGAEVLNRLNPRLQDRLLNTDFSGVEMRILSHDESARLAIMKTSYQPPNGGHRILPSAYTRLRQGWYRSNGKYIAPQCMNDGHLENTIKLLKESHGNLVGRSTDLLGRMAMHFRNQPDVVAQLESLCLRMQEIEVDEVYPVFGTLADEAAARIVKVEITEDDWRDDMFDHVKDW